MPVSISRELLNSWKIVWRSVRLPWSSDKHYLWDSGHKWQKPRHMFICFPSLPQMHTKREGPCDLKIQFANVKSLLVINSPLKMCRACTFKCKCLTGLRAGESNLSTRLQAHTDWHLHHWTAVTMSWPVRASCHHTRTRSTHWGQRDVHFLRSQGGFIEFHRTSPREGWWPNKGHGLWRHHTWFYPASATCLPQCPQEVTTSLQPQLLHLWWGTSSTFLGGLSGQLSQTRNVECWAQSLEQSKHSVTTVISESEAVDFGLTWGSCCKQQSC